MNPLTREEGERGLLIYDGVGLSGGADRRDIVPMTKDVFNYSTELVIELICETV